MEKERAITIRTISNGFIVCPEIDQSISCAAKKEIMVFRSMAELCDYIGTHFKYRCPRIEVDNLQGDEKTI